MANRHWAEVTGRERDRPPTVVLVSIEDVGEGGYFLTALDARGTAVSSTWHGGLEVARQWAESEYGRGDVGRWREIPDQVRDPTAYALRQVRR